MVGSSCFRQISFCSQIMCTPLLSSTSSRLRLNRSGTCGTAGKVMRVGRVPLKRGQRVPGPPNLSPALPAIPVLHPGLEHLRPLPCKGASRSATGALQVSSGRTGGHNLQGRVVLLGPLGKERGQRNQAKENNSSLPSPRAAPEPFCTFLFVFILRVCLFVSLDPGTVPRAPSHLSRLPLGGWAEDGQSVSRHPEPVPEEGSEDELPPQVHKVRAPGPSNKCQT